MTITQTVEVPADRRLVIDVPREIPTGPVVLAFTPAADRSRKSVDQGSATAIANTGEERSPHPHSDALFAIFSQIRGDIDIDELRTERLAKHLP